MDTSDDSRKFREDYPESGTRRLSFRKGDFIGQKYEVVDVLGEGGFGTVYLVHYNFHDSFYAIKTFKAEFLNNEIVRERFRKEAQVWINLDKHPYLVSAYWAEEISNRLFVAMEWIAPSKDGSPNSLHEYLAHKPPDLIQSIRWAIQFCYGMEYAYSKGLKAHRDIKPANIMIDCNMNVRISDFGLAGIVTPDITPQNNIAANMHQTMIGTSIGTPTHMSPEQFMNFVACDERSDVYSFGIVLYQLASGGRLPFYADDNQHAWAVLKYQHCEAPVPKLDSELFPLIQRCLEKEPRRRYQAFRELRTDLDGVYKKLTGEVFVPLTIAEMSSSDWNNKGVSLNNLSKYREAIECFDKAIDVDHLNAGAWHNKGSSLHCLGQANEALICCQKALEINPSHTGALINKGNILARLGKLDDAFKCLIQALDIKPANLYLISQLVGMLSSYGFKRVEINTACEKIVNLDLNPTDVDGLFNLGLTYLQLDDKDKALSIFLKAEKLDEDDCSVWFELMNIYFEKQDADNTLKYCDKLISSNKYIDQAVKKKSLVLANTVGTQQAICLLKDVLANHESLDLLWLTLSGLYERSHDYEEALKAAKKCLQVLEISKSNDKSKINYVANVINGLNQKLGSSTNTHINNAIQNLKSAELKYYKQKMHFDAIKQLIQLYLNDRDKEQSLYYCDMLIKTSNYITDFGNKAIVMSYFGDYTGAAPLLTDILKEWPRNDSLWYVLSTIHENNENYLEALKAVSKCKDILFNSENPNRQNISDIESKIKALQKLI